LINQGAIPVDFYGEVITVTRIESSEVEESSLSYERKPPTPNHPSMDDTQILEVAINMLKEKGGRGLKPNELVDKYNLDAKTSKKINTILSKSSKLKKEKKGRFNYFYLNESIPKQGQIF
jgi:predicted transcriptional regulator